MKTTQKLTISVLLTLIVVLTGCSSGSQIYFDFTSSEIPISSSKNEPNPQEPPKDTIKIASFNIQVFGKTKASKPGVMIILAETISKFDIVAIQEIRDKAGTAIEKLVAEVDALGIDYAYVIGPRLGRTTAKEQYAFFYRTDTVEFIDSYTYDDSVGDVFHREPLAGHFKAKHGKFDFVLVTIHTDPDEALEEIQVLADTITDAAARFNEPDVIALGDFNADCSYYDESLYTLHFPSDKYIWVIDNTADTTVGGTDCSYDRIVITDTASEDYTQKYGVYRFDTVHGLSEEHAKKVSDHYPVWAEFWVNRDTD